MVRKMKMKYNYRPWVIRAIKILRGISFALAGYGVLGFLPVCLAADWERFDLFLIFAASVFISFIAGMAGIGVTESLLKRNEQGFYF